MADELENEWWDRFESETPMNAVYTESYCLTCWWHSPDDEEYSNAKEHMKKHPLHTVRTTNA